MHRGRRRGRLPAFFMSCLSEFLFCQKAWTRFYLKGVNRGRVGGR